MNKKENKTIIKSQIWDKDDFYLNADGSNFTRINNEIPFMEELNDIDVVIFTIIKQTINVRQFSILNIQYIINRLQLNSKKSTNMVKESIQNLINNNIITVYDETRNILDNISNLKISNIIYIIFPEDDKLYFKVEDSDFEKVIIESKKCKNRMSFIRYYLMIRRNVNFNFLDGESLIGYMSYSTVNNIIFNNQTIANYNEMLQNINVIYYTNSFINKNTKENCATRFGLVCTFDNKKQFINAVKKELGDRYIECDKTERSCRIKNGILKSKNKNIETENKNDKNCDKNKLKGFQDKLKN